MNFDYKWNLGKKNTLREIVDRYRCKDVGPRR